MEMQRFRRLQEEYGQRQCPECEGTMTLFMEYGQLYECCHNVECGFEGVVEEDEI